MEIVYLIENPKEKGTFNSASWRKDCSSYLSMITQDLEGDDITTARHISNGFPRSQHRPVVLHYGLRIPLIPDPFQNIVGTLLESIMMDLPEI
jgi:hypothetical protein